MYFYKHSNIEYVQRKKRRDIPVFLLEVCGQRYKCFQELEEISLLKRLAENTVPNDPRSPFVTSGVRVGTPAITTRGFGETETAQLGRLICRVLDNIEDEAVIAEVREAVHELCRRFPVYRDAAVREAAA